MSELTGLYNKNETIVVNDLIFKKWYELSNYCLTLPITINENVLQSVVHLYEALKYPHIPELQYTIISQYTAEDVILHSSFYQSETRKDWEEIKTYLMRWCIELKLTQNYHKFSTVLKQTGGKVIVYESFYDDFWGAIPNENGYLVGRNRLGSILTDIRDTFYSYPDFYSKKLSKPKYLDKKNNIIEIKDLMLYNVNIK